MTNTNLKMYIDNSREIYCITEWLAGCVAKRMKKGQPIELDYLAECSTMKKIVRIGAQMCARFGEDQPDKEERKEVARALARYIIEDFAPAFL